MSGSGIYYLLYRIHFGLLRKLALQRYYSGMHRLPFDHYIIFHSIELWVCSIKNQERLENGQRNSNF